jgi:LPXTG-motif cell wall-anchored protein
MRTFAIASLSVLFAIVTLLASAHAAPHAATMNVAAKDFEFDPKTITITVGDTITWTNQGKMPHTVTASDNSFDSGNLASGATFSHTFDKAGTFAYYCKYHGKADGTGMAATVIVQEAGAAQPAAAAQPTAAAAADQATEQNSLEADDQALTNNSVNVKEVYSAQDGWMVIHLDENNAPGKVIGHTAVKKGESTDVKVTLDQPVSAGTKVWPMLHIDAGTSGTYEFPGPDLPAKGADGMVVMKQISLTGGQSAPAKAAPSTLPNTGGDDLPLTPLASLAALLIGSGFLAKRARRRS